MKTAAATKKKIAESRSKPRVEAKMRIRVEGEFGEIRTYHGNISKSGVYLETADPFAQLGEKVHLEIFLPNTEDTVRVRGKVIRVTKPNQVGMPQGVAIQFMRMDQKYVRKLDDYIDVLFDGKGVGCRRHARVMTHIWVELKGKHGTSEVVADNLGHGGLFLKVSSDGIEIGDHVQLVILHPSSRRRFFVEAEVVHVRKSAAPAIEGFEEGLGVQFVNVPGQRKKDLSSFLKSILHYQRRLG